MSRAFVCWLAFLLSDCVSFNMDTKYVLFMPGPKGSHFGYRVELSGSRVLVGAPKANSLTPYLKRSLGALFYCDIETSTCEEFTLEDRAIKTDRKPTQKEIRWENSWIGGSLDISDTKEPHIVVCGHLWKNVLHTTDTQYFTNGICYVIDANQKVRRLQPLTDEGSQTDDSTWFYGLGCNGLSAKFLQGSDDLVMGAPGVYNFSGTITLIDVYEYQQPINNRKNLFSVQNSIASQLPRYSYFGYSVSSGRFFDSEETQLVIGAPRQDDHGKVYIFKKPESPKQIELEHAFTFYGSQVKINNAISFAVTNKRRDSNETNSFIMMGEYFGASLCSVDFNNDGMSDLLIGAPLFAYEYEEGRVYMYINNGKGFLKLLSSLNGRSPRSRFGSSISAIGDLNQDSYQDIAIGAPYEDNNGVVYIYHGCSNGLKLTQIISAKEIGENLQGFGISISKGKDVDNNGYPDIAVGAYESDQIAVLRSRPLVSITADIKFDRRQVNLRIRNCSFNNMPSSCFSVTVEFMANGYPNSKFLKLEASLLMDSDYLAKKRPSRGFISLNNESNAASNNFTINLNKNPNHVTFISYITNSDYPDPIQFHLSYTLPDPPSEIFCSLCPIVNSSSATSITREIPLQNEECGADNVCQSDLELTANINGYSENKPFNLGSSEKINLQIKIVNSGEPAFALQVIIWLPQDTSLFRNYQSCEENYNETRNQKFLNCEFLRYPLKDKELISFVLEFDVRNIKIHQKMLSFDVEVVTASTEVNLNNNKQTLNLPLRLDGTISIDGSANSNPIIFPKISTNVTGEWNLFYNFKIHKYGSSPIKSVIVEFTVPTKTKDEQIEFIRNITFKPQVNAVQSSSPLCKVASSKNTSKSGEFNQPTPPSAKGPLKDQQQLSAIDCNTTACKTQKFICGSFTSHEIALIELQLSISKENFLKLIGTSNEVKLKISAFVTIEDKGFEKSNSEVQVSTVFIREGSVPSKSIAAWIIPVCVLIALIILLLIGFILWKVGFFRRKKKEEMSRQQGDTTSGSALENRSLLTATPNEKRVSWKDENETGSVSAATD